MVKRVAVDVVAGGFGLLGVLIVGGCSTVPASPSYEEVRGATVSAVGEILSTFPSDAVVVQRPDGEPYACKTRDSADVGYMYTGQWDITLPASTDVAKIIEALPASVGAQWAVTKGSLPRTATYVDITDSQKHVGASVTGASDPTSGPGINILATSACGKKSSD